MALIHEYASNINNKGVTHVFLGNPLSNGNEKTVIEPGNVFSPGIGTVGIYPVIESKGSAINPTDLQDSEMIWGFENSPFWTPVLKASYQAGNISCSHSIYQTWNEEEGAVDKNSVIFKSDSDTQVSFHLIIKETGPAGGMLSSAEQNGRTVTVNSSIGICFNLDISLSTDMDAEEPYAIISAAADLKQNTPLEIRFSVSHEKGDNTSVEFSTESVGSDWAKALPATINCPDKDLMRVWNECAYHILAVMETGLPRIGAVNYPVFWIRDCIIVLRALDLMGRHDLARIGCNYLAPLMFSGGFGSESDAPGEGIWALVQHARMTGDYAWLEDIFPHIEERVSIILEMRSANQILHRESQDLMPRHLDNPEARLLCYAAKNSLINGRMDWHSPNFYINAWAYAGLSCAAQAAELTGNKNKAGEWNREAEEMTALVKTHLLPEYGNSRDLVCTPYPTELLKSDSELKSAFSKWFSENRLTENGERNPEKLWTYFEAAQIHNAFILGMKDEAWTCLSGMLKDRSAYDVSAFIEGNPDGNENLPYKNSEGLSGWLDRKKAAGGNMPHNWTTAELINCIRDMFVREKDGQIILGTGVPQPWLEPGQSFGVKDMPTSLGTVSYSVTVKQDNSIDIDFSGPGNYIQAF